MQNNCSELGTRSEADLVRLAQEGSVHAFSELMRRSYPSSFNLAQTILRDRYDAEDEVQNAYWKAHQHINQFQQDARFSTWMTRIVVNQCLMRLRQARRVRFHYLDEIPPGADRNPLELKDQGNSPERELGNRELREVLAREIRRIPPLLREVFVLREVEERSMADVSERLGITVAAAKSRLLRARLELRQRLMRHCGSVGPATLLT